MDSAERNVLGSVLITAAAMVADLEAAGLKPSDFSLDSHRRIFAAMVCLHRAATPLDVITLVDQLHRTGELESIGGIAYLTDLTSGCVPLRTHVLFHAEMVIRDSRRRRLRDIGERLSKLAPECDPAELATQITAELVEVRDGR